MKIANISTTKNNLSKLLDEVKSGETVVIVDRNTPIARLEPVSSSGTFAGRLQDLQRRGIVSLPERRIDVHEFIGRERRARLQPGASAIEAINKERAEGM